MDKQKINDMIKEHFEIVEQTKQLKDRDDQIKAEMKIIMKQLGVNSHEDENNNIVSWKEQTTRRIDRKKVEAILTEEEFDTVFSESVSEPVRFTSKKQIDFLKERSKK